MLCTNDVFIVINVMIRHLLPRPAFTLDAVRRFSQIHDLNAELHAGRVDPRVGSGRVGSENLQIRVGRVGSSSMNNKIYCKI